MSGLREDLKLSTFPHALPPRDNLDITKCGDAGTERGAEAESPRVSAERVSMVTQQKWGGSTGVQVAVKLKCGSQTKCSLVFSQYALRSGRERHREGVGKKWKVRQGPGLIPAHC